jgi:hypothetical protein
MAIIGAVAAMGSTGAFATSIISFGTDPGTGNHTVTQTITIPTQLLNVLSPNSLFSFLGFSALGLGGGATYVGGGTSTFDYEFTDTVTQFQITNNDTSTDTVNASVQSVVKIDSTSTMPNNALDGVHFSGDNKTVGQDLGIGFTGTTEGNLTHNVASITNQVLGAGQTVFYSPLPVTFTDGIGFNNCSSFGDINSTDGCAQSLASAIYATTGFTWGTTDLQAFQSSLTGSGNLNLNIIATTQYDVEAEVTYEYTLSSGTPEPTTMALMGGALLGLGLLGKRFKKS